MSSDPIVLLLLDFILPLWILAGFADWACHRASHIESTAGAKESVIHFLMFAEVSVPLLAALFFNINALIIAMMIAAFFAHEATTYWDISYASSRREVTPIEQMVHSFLEMLPLLGIVCIVALHWGQFLALFGLGSESAKFTLAWKSDPLPAIYIISVLAGIFLLELIPYSEEFLRGLRKSGGKLVPAPKSGRDAAVASEH